MIEHFIKKYQIRDPIILKWFRSTLANYINKKDIPGSLNNTFLVKMYLKYKRLKYGRISVIDVLNRKINFKRTSVDTNLVRYVFLKLVTKNEYEKYGFKLRNCLLNYYDKKSSLYVLINETCDEVVCAVEVDRGAVMQIQGYLNKGISSKYWHIIKQNLLLFKLSNQKPLNSIGYVTLSKYLYDDDDMVVTEIINISSTEDIVLRNKKFKKNVHINCEKQVRIENCVFEKKLICKKGVYEFYDIVVQGNFYCSYFEKDVLDGRRISLKKSIYIQNSNIQKIINIPRVYKNLNISGTDIKTLKQMSIDGDLYAIDSKLKYLPKRVNGSLVLDNSFINGVKYFTINRDLSLQGTSIKQLSNIHIKGNLDISDTRVSFLDNTVIVDGMIFTEKNNIQIANDKKWTFYHKKRAK